MLCLKCMKMTRTAVCENCGFDYASYQPRPFALKPGTVLNNYYLIGTVLGAGGFGITYSAFDNSRFQRVAIKEFFPEKLVSRDTRISDTVRVYNNRNFDKYIKGANSSVNEAKKLIELSDVPGIVKIIDFFVENSTTYIVMEYLEQSMKNVITRQGPLPWDIALRLCFPVLEALQMIHSHDIIHRDISPDNLMIDKNANVKLIDFGAAREFAWDMTTDMTRIIKKGYSPIEQYSRRERHAPHEDIYAFSATLYHIITGVIPPESINRVPKEQDTLIMPSRTGLFVPAALNNILLKGLSPELDERYQSAAQMAEAIRTSGLMNANFR